MMMMDMIRLDKVKIIIIASSLMLGVVNIVFMPSMYRLFSRKSQISAHEHKYQGVSRYRGRLIARKSLFGETETGLTLNDKSNDFISTYFPWSNVTRALPNFFTVRSREGKNIPVTSYQENTAIVFVHIPKSAGTTTNRCLENVAEKRALKKPQNIWLSNYLQFYKSLKSGKYHRQRAYFGLFSLGVCDFVDQPCSYFTVFRDPMERTISSYMYCQKASTDKICHAADARNMTVKQWALHQASVVFYQLLHNPEFCEARYNAEAVELMKGKDVPRNRHLDIPCWYQQILLLEKRINDEGRQRILNFILSNMEQLFTLIGLTDKYDETLQMLEKAYDLPFHSVCAGDVRNKAVYNVTGDNASGSKKLIVEKLKEDLMGDSEVRKVLHEDMEIYKEAVRIFKEQIDIFKRLP
ncbi:uncharacterized protein [Ptychodera flava]|uniref:uncharacterized protein n=1 Tax=Ptychodera flava TaxID=63121 RepID=UPI003969C6BA